MGDEVKGLPEQTVATVISLYQGELTKVRVRSELSEKIFVQIEYFKDLCYRRCILQLRLM